MRINGLFWGHFHDTTKLSSPTNFPPVSSWTSGILFSFQELIICRFSIFFIEFWKRQNHSREKHLKNCCLTQKCIGNLSCVCAIAIDHFFHNAHFSKHPLRCIWFFSLSKCFMHDNDVQGIQHLPKIRRQDWKKKSLHIEQRSVVFVCRFYL